jgi:hypothetical protein
MMCIFPLDSLHFLHTMFGLLSPLSNTLPAVCLTLPASFRWLTRMLYDHYILSGH